MCIQEVGCKTNQNEGKKVTNQNKEVSFLQLAVPLVVNQSLNVACFKVSSHFCFCQNSE
jgi:hypothetical protein